jgi:hypothetical protein
MISISKTLVALAAAALMAAAADTSMLNLLMPDAKFVAGVRVEQARNSPFGQFFLNQMIKDEDGLRKLVEATGFDPRTDLIEVVVGTASDRPHGQGLAVARGRFDISRIISTARTSGATVSTYLDAQVISHPGKNGEGWVAFLNSGVALAGDTDNVRAAVDRSKRAGAGLPADMITRSIQLSGQYDVWAVTQMGLSRLSAAMPDPNVRGAMNGNIVQGIDQASGGVRFGANVQVDGEAVMRTEKDATAFADVIRFLASMVGSHRDNAQASQVAIWLESMNIRTTGNSVKLSLSIPENDFENFFLNAKGRGHARLHTPRQ